MKITYDGVYFEDSEEEDVSLPLFLTKEDREDIKSHPLPALEVVSGVWPVYPHG